MITRDELAQTIFDVPSENPACAPSPLAVADAILARYVLIDRPEPNGGMGIEWKSHGDLVSGRVLAIGDDGELFEILSVTYTVEQAAQMAAQLIDAIGGKQ